MFRSAMIDIVTALAIHDNGIYRVGTDITPGAAQVVLNVASLNYVIQPRQMAIITQESYIVETDTDDCQFELGYVDAGGVFHSRCMHCHIYTPAALLGRTSFDSDFCPPIVLRYSAGCRRITFRVDANDAACVISAGYRGVWISEASFINLRI